MRGDSVFTYLRRVGDIAVAVAVVGVAGAFVYLNAREIGASQLWKRIVAPPRVMSLQDAHTEGSERAPVVMVMFSDYECSYCAQFALSTLPVLRDRFVESGRLLLVFRHLPLLRVHQHAWAAAKAAECAGDQGRFAPMHDALFASQDRLDSTGLLKIGVRIGLDVQKLRRCIDAESDSAIWADTRLASRFGIAHTPTFLIGQRSGNEVVVREMVEGALPVEHFIGVISRVAERVAEGR